MSNMVLQEVTVTFLLNTTFVYHLKMKTYLFKAQLCGISDICFSFAGASFSPPQHKKQSFAPGLARLKMRPSRGPPAAERFTNSYKNSRGGAPLPSKPLRWEDGAKDFAELVMEHGKKDKKKGNSDDKNTTTSIRTRPLPGNRTATTTTTTTRQLTGKQTSKEAEEEEIVEPRKSQRKRDARRMYSPPGQEGQQAKKTKKK